MESNTKTPIKLLGRNFLIMSLKLAKYYPNPRMSPTAMSPKSTNTPMKSCYFTFNNECALKKKKKYKHLLCIGTSMHKRPV